MHAGLKVRGPLRGHAGAVTCAAFMPPLDVFSRVAARHQHLLASGSADRSVRLWSSVAPRKGEEAAANGADAFVPPGPVLKGERGGWRESGGACGWPACLQWGTCT